MGSGPGEVRSGPNETVEIRRRHQPLQFYFHEIELVDQEKFAFVTFLLADQKRIPGPRPFDSLGRSGRGRPGDEAGSGARVFRDRWLKPDERIEVSAWWRETGRTGASSKQAMLRPEGPPRRCRHHLHYSCGLLKQPDRQKLYTGT